MKAKKITLRGINKLIKSVNMQERLEATKMNKDYYLLHICKNGNPVPLLIGNINEVYELAKHYCGNH